MHPYINGICTFGACLIRVHLDVLILHEFVHLNLIHCMFHCVCNRVTLCGSHIPILSTICWPNLHIGNAQWTS